MSVRARTPARPRMRLEARDSPRARPLKGQRALERSTVCRCSVRREHDLDRQLEQRTQAFDGVLPRQVWTQPAGIDLEPATEVDKRVAGDDGAMALDPEHHVVRLLSGKRLDADVQSVACRVRVRVADALLEEPDDVGAAVAGLFGGEAVRLHEVIAVSGSGVYTGTPSRSTRRCASRSCHGAVSTTAVSRSAASFSISLGGAIGSKSNRRSSLSIAYEETF